MIINEIIPNIRQYDTPISRNYDETKTTFLLYNGALEADEDPADYITPIKAVRLG